MGLLALVLLTGACGGAMRSDTEPLPGEEVTEPEQCLAAGGHVIGDPGDGSVHREGCPAGEEFLGSVRFGIEGGICCRKRP